MISDFNIHLYTKDSENIDDQILEDTELNPANLVTNLLRFKEHFKSSGVLSANFHLFNSYVFDMIGFEDFRSLLAKEFPGSMITLLCDYKNKEIEIYLDRIKSKGFSFIKFHSYVQDITEEDYVDISNVAVEAEKRGLGICIDASYGTNKIFTNDNLALAAHILEKVTKTPVILLHSGGPRIFECMLLALQNSNVYLETSLSLDFYDGSRLWEDYSFVYRRIGLERVLFASDFPYQSVDDAFQTFSRFANGMNLTHEELEQITKGNFQRIGNSVCNT